ncbi:hypothetical protein FZ103_18315 [Streptomonospora sp. PA3]|uniref:hypothetical protein n=1 Tax=Streptomonospora sp. PA3 TaxID=2607326 RepID=UPI0012DC3C0E|nr:hypothetical protein [Streptomonospora sp. PA3]MUL43096.1 hypothetical protein [Streptomonospora sp. PA3]
MELIVIGSGFSISLAVLVVAFADPDLNLLTNLMKLSWMALFALPFVYTCGVIVDRVADYILRPIKTKLKRSVFASDARYADAKFAVDSHNLFSTHADYARSRMRVVRGGILNGAATTLSLLSWFVFANPPDALKSFLVVLSVVFLFFTAGCFFAWTSIVKTTYKKTRSQHESLARQDSLIT